MGVPLARGRGHRQRRPQHSSDETARAVETADGHRAWVIRDTLPKLDPAIAGELRLALAGIRKRPGAASTSDASATAARFGGLPDPSHSPRTTARLTDPRRTDRP